MVGAIGDVADGVVSAGDDSVEDVGVGSEGGVDEAVSWEDLVSEDTVEVCDLGGDEDERGVPAYTSW